MSTYNGQLFFLSSQQMKNTCLHELVDTRNYPLDVIMPWLFLVSSEIKTIVVLKKRDLYAVDWYSV